MDWNNRILVVDGDNTAHGRIQKILKPYELQLRLNSAKIQPLSWLSPLQNDHMLEITYEVNGVESGSTAFQKLTQARLEQRPFSVVFIDEILPGNQNSIITMERIWEEYPFTEIIFMTSNPKSWTEILQYTGPTGRLSFIDKPIDPIRVQQMVLSLSIRWSQNKHTQKFTLDLEQEVKRRIHKLELILEENPELYKEPGSIPVLAHGSLLGDGSFRVLIVDDNKSIHEDFKKVLSKPQPGTLQSTLDSFEDQLFGDEEPETPNHELNIPFYQLDSAFQGKDALDMVVAAEKEGNPYSVIFMDVRMPPGWDGIQTIEKIWMRFPYIEMVIVTAHADYSWEEILQKVGSTDRLSILKKPFDSTTIKQLALTLTQKWALAYMARRSVEALEQEVETRTGQLRSVLRLI